LSSYLPEVNVHASGVNDFSAYRPTNPLKVETKHGVNGVTVCHLSHTYFLNPVTFFFQRKPKLRKGLSDDVQDRIRMYRAWYTFVFDCVHIHKISCGDAMPCGFAMSFPSAISRRARLSVSLSCESCVPLPDGFTCESVKVILDNAPYFSAERIDVRF